MRKRIALAAVAIVVTVSPTLVAQPPSAEELLARAIDYHDANDVWRQGIWRLTLGETRPDGTVRRTVLMIDNPAGRFDYSTQDGGDRIEGSLSDDDCSFRLNGSGTFTEEEQERHRLTCERLERMRNYYTYLWGLPMKLRDPGTRLDAAVGSDTFGGSRVTVLRVSYEESVGRDTWYFYLDPSSYALVGYRFFHDESANDGEYIILDQEVETEGLRIPRVRAWYTNADQRYLGTDTLESLERLDD
ncbi:MAG: DUF6503 family protein [Thermoanaerobaculia bacterium]